MTEDQLFEIAKIIDNEFIGTEKTFTVSDNSGYWMLSTNKCDDASMIKIYYNNNKEFYSIERIGPYTEAWQEIHSQTWEKIEKYLTSLNKLKNQKKQ